jgi:hypothetical protein
METKEIRGGSAVAQIISDLSYEYEQAIEANSRVVASDSGNIEQLSFIQKQVEGLSGKIAVALSLSETESDTEKLSELTKKCEALYDNLSEATGKF